MTEPEEVLYSQETPYPKPAYAWYMVIILTIAYVLSFVDRYILGLLVEPIKADLNLTDTQMGLLLGPAFAIFYALMGLPLGSLADRKRRTWIVAMGVLLWSAATTLSGLAKNFVQLFIARMCVGVGEATLSPCTMSLIADSFPRARRARPIALYSTAISLGVGLSALVGGAIIGWVNSAEAIILPFLGELEAWQLTMIIVGLPGVLIAPLLLLLREPVRRQDSRSASAENVSMAETIKYISARLPLFTSFVSVFCLMTIIGYSTSWGASMFSRTWGWSPSQYGQVVGIMFLIVGPLSVNFAGWLSDHLYSKKIYEAPLLVPLIGVPIMVVAGIIWPLMPTPEGAIVVLAITMMGVAFATATGVTALLNIIPSNIRGRTVAIYYMCISFFGLGFGPTTIGLLNDFVFGSENLRYSMAVLPLIYGLPVICLMPLIRRLYLAEFEKRIQEA